jgi:hypothetical protein
VVPFVRGRVAKEHTDSRARGEFVGCRGIEIGVEEATKHLEGRVIQELWVEKLVGNGMLYGRGGVPVEQICGGG